MSICRRELYQAIDIKRGEGKSSELFLSAASTCDRVFLNSCALFFSGVTPAFYLFSIDFTIGLGPIVILIIYDL